VLKLLEPDSFPLLALQFCSGGKACACNPCAFSLSESNAITNAPGRATHGDHAGGGGWN